MCAWFQKLSSPPTEGIFHLSLPPLWKFHINSIHFFKILVFESPPSNRNFQCLLWGEGNGYFLKPHNRANLMANSVYVHKIG